MNRRGHSDAERKMQQAEQQIRNMIATSHKAGLCEANGVAVKRPVVSGSHGQSRGVGTPYQYIYAGPGPDCFEVVLIGFDGGKGVFESLDTGMFKDKTVVEHIDCRRLCPIGPERWHSLIRRQGDTELGQMMLAAYNEKFHGVPA